MVPVRCGDGEYRRGPRSFTVLTSEFMQHGRTLEQLEEIFDSSWPARASMKKVKVKLDANGSVDILEQDEKK